MQPQGGEYEAELMGAKRRLARLKERHLRRKLSRAGKPIDQAAIRELRADVLDGGPKEEAEPGPQSQALRVLHRLVGQLLLGGQADPPLSSKQIYSQLSQGASGAAFAEALAASGAEEGLEGVVRGLGEGEGACLEVEGIDVGGRTAVMVLGITNRGRLASLAGLPAPAAPGGTPPAGLSLPAGNRPGAGAAGNTGQGGGGMMAGLAGPPGMGTGPGPREPTPAPAAPVDLDQLLSKSSALERQRASKGVELLGLIDKPTAKESAVVERFRTEGGVAIREYCPHLTKDDCRRANHSPFCCPRLHFLRLIFPWTDPALGNCSYLDSCRHMKTCKYIHYELDDRPDVPHHMAVVAASQQKGVPKYLQALEEPQWINCDVRTFDMTLLGKFGVIMTDPPWEIHQDLPYGTMADDETRNLNIGCLQDEGVIFVWVTGRAMELGRECLKLWGYNRVDELIWVKTNQLQRLIRTGRTGHWLNHSKEHCLVGIKGSPAINRNVDCDVVVAEVRETSRKPDEMYPLLERLWPGTRKIEIFARTHNLRPGWVSLGNQLDGTRLMDPELKARYEAKYGAVKT
ncbi:hypothetical protein N2152v2_009927 [Parachlorella kessleri]